MLEAVGTLFSCSSRYYDRQLESQTTGHALSQTRRRILLLNDRGDADRKLIAKEKANDHKSV